MPCDFLPIVSNGLGDWLALRVKPNGTASEVVQWYHGGGDWISWGNSLAEALLFDAIHLRLPGPSRRHAIPAQTVEAHDFANNDWLRWALEHLPEPITQITRDDLQGDSLASLMIENCVSEIGVRCELVQDALDESLSQILTPKVASEFEVDWNTAVQWMFDVRRVPSAARDRFQSKYNYTNDHAQNWPVAAQHARRVTEIASHCGWAWEILGYAQEVSGQTSQAVESYHRGATCSVFTDQAVRLRTHWTANQSLKFAAARLAEIDPGSIDKSAYLQILCDGNEEASRVSVTKYWLDQAANAESGSEAVNHLMRAGWDVGAEPISTFSEILSKLVDATRESNQHGRSLVAQAHRNCLRDRFGV